MPYLLNLPKDWYSHTDSIIKLRERGKLLRNYVAMYVCPRTDEIKTAARISLSSAGSKYVACIWVHPPDSHSLIGAAMQGGDMGAVAVYHALNRMNINVAELYGHNHINPALKLIAEAMDYKNVQIFEFAQ